MPCMIRFNNYDTDFAEKLMRVKQLTRGQADNIELNVKDIISTIRTKGDDGLIALTEKFDHQKLTPDRLRITQAEIDAAEAECDVKLCEALDLAAQRIYAYHETQKPEDMFYTDAAQVGIGHKWTPIDAAGLYVPGGKASYPSSVLMNAIPARVAGVKRIVMSVPTPYGEINPLVLAAAKRAGVDEIYRIGGAQAIAALAYGTHSIAPVNVIVGPGNAYVTEAKKQVFGTVGIDMLAGPSEILVVADAQNDPAWIAADLLSQAEHDEQAQSILVCDDDAFADAVETEIARQLGQLPRADIARTSWENFGVIIVLDELRKNAVNIVNTLAPEHTELAVEEPHKMAEHITHSGALFLGRHTPEAIGDYIAGPNHVLPTARTARYASGLSVLNFMKRSSLIACDAQSLRTIGMPAALLADSEGLDAHARSIRIRLNESD